MELFFEGDTKSPITVTARIDNDNGTAETVFQLQNTNVPGNVVVIDESKEMEISHSFLVPPAQLTSGDGHTCNMRLSFFPVSKNGSETKLFLKCVQKSSALVAKDLDGKVLHQDPAGVDLGKVDLKTMRKLFFFISF